MPDADNFGESSSKSHLGESNAKSDVSDNSCSLSLAGAPPLPPLKYNWGEQKEKINKSSNTQVLPPGKRETQNIVKKIRFSLCFATSFLASKSLQCDF